MKKYWVISEASEVEQEEGSARWIAFPATENTLAAVKVIAGLFESKLYVAEEVEEL